MYVASQAHKTSKMVRVLTFHSVTMYIGKTTESMHFHIDFWDQKASHDPAVVAKNIWQNFVKLTWLVGEVDKSMIRSQQNILMEDSYRTYSNPILSIP